MCACPPPRINGIAEADGTFGHLFGRLCLLVDPVERGLLPALNLLGLEPQSDFLLGILDAVATMANVAADVLWEGVSVISSSSGCFGTGGQ